MKNVSVKNNASVFSRFIRVTFHFDIFHSFVVELMVPIFLVYILYI